MNNNDKRSIDSQTIADFWKAGISDRYGSVLALSTPLTALGLGVAIPYCIGKILAGLAQPGTDIQQYIYLLIGFSIFVIIHNRITFDAFLAWQPKIMARLQTTALTSLMNRGLTFHNNQVSGKLVSDALDYPSAYSQLTTVLIIDILPFLLVMVIGIILVTLSSPLIGLVLFGMTFLTIGATIRFRRKMVPFRKQRLIATKAVTAHIADVIVNTMTVKSFGNEKHEINRHGMLSNKLLLSRLHDWHAVAVDGTYRIVGLLAFEIIFVLLVVHQVQANPELLATGIFAFSYTVTLTNRLFQIGTMMRSVEESLLLAAPMTEALRQQPEIRDMPAAKPLDVPRGLIELQNIDFAYTDNAKSSNIFTQFNLIIQPGEKIGLVGPSGGGKSTLTRLLLRFEDIQSGQIIIDGQNIAEVSQVSLHQAIGYVPQEPLLFHRSIRDNIAYGKLDASDSEIAEAARKAYALTFIEALPDGMDTIVGERGVKLSGGQRQRIAIARAMLKDAPILLLDEATSALDSESEHVIQKALQKLMLNRTTIVIAHRLSTIQRLDRIVVLEDGAVTEQGSHKQLITASGTYAKLWSHQSGGFIEE